MFVSVEILNVVIVYKLKHLNKGKKNRFVSANMLKSKRVGRRNFLFYVYFFRKKL